ncbi:response regulator [Microbispora rosea]
MIRVVLADDERLIRTGWTTMLSFEDDIEVVGEAADGHEAVEAGIGADVVLMDIRMPRMDGLAASRELARRSPTTRVIVVTTFENDQLVWGAPAPPATCSSARPRTNWWTLSGWCTLATRCSSPTRCAASPGRITARQGRACRSG